MQIIRGKQPSALKVVVYGPEGIGKTTFASQFPNPLFIDTEGSTRHMDVARTPTPTSWPLLLGLVQEVAANPSLCHTLVIDTADWAEQLCVTYVCDKYQKKGIEEFGYGKGYVFVSEEFGRLLNLLGEVLTRGVHVVLTAHAKLRKFEQPDEMGAYDRWEMKLSKNVAPMVKEWADMVLFANYKTYAVKNEDGKVKAQGGDRRMFTTHHPCWDAKNRHGLPSELPFSFSAIAPTLGSTEQAKDEPLTAESTPVNKSASAAAEGREKTQPQAAPQESAAPVDYSCDFAPDIPDGIPQALADLMRQDNVTATDLQMAVSSKGYFPLGMAVADYPPDFVSGCLIGAWPDVLKIIQQDKKKIPF